MPDSADFELLAEGLMVKWEHFGVFRRFVLPIEKGKAFEALLAKCHSLEKNADYDLCWTDYDEDLIRIESECDMGMAIREMDGDLLRIYSAAKPEQKKPVKQPENKKPQNTTGAAHPGVVCDGCDEQIVGHRFKCLVCPDYDLCAKCEQGDEHKQHVMMRIVSPDATPIPSDLRYRSRIMRVPSFTLDLAEEALSGLQSTFWNGANDGAAAGEDMKNKAQENCQRAKEEFRTFMGHLQEALANFGLDPKQEKPTETQKPAEQPAQNADEPPVLQPEPAQQQPTVTIPEATVEEQMNFEELSAEELKHIEEMTNQAQPTQTANAPTSEGSDARLIEVDTAPVAHPMPVQSNQYVPPHPLGGQAAPVYPPIPQMGFEQPAWPTQGIPPHPMSMFGHKQPFPGFGIWGPPGMRRSRRGHPHPLQPQPAPPARPTLTPRERQELGYVAAGIYDTLHSMGFEKHDLMKEAARNTQNVERACEYYWIHQ
ncbi:unnamed protein product, partial [Mesorhabditis spiculigera]